MPKQKLEFKSQESKENSPKLHLEKAVMQKIKSGQVKMRPRMHFVVGPLFMGAGLAGVITLAVFFVNIASFKLRTLGSFGYLWFGQYGIRPFLATFPWAAFVVAICGLVIGISLLRRYDISYKKSFVGLILGLIAVVLTVGWLMDLTGINERFERFGHMRGLYQEEFAGNDWIMGEVIAAEKDQLQIETPNGNQATIQWNDKTLLPFGSDFKVGDKIRAVGKWSSNTTFKAIGIGRGGMHWQRGERGNGMFRGGRDSN